MEGDGQQPDDSNFCKQWPGHRRRQAGVYGSIGAKSSGLGWEPPSRTEGHIMPGSITALPLTATTSSKPIEFQMFNLKIKISCYLSICVKTHLPHWIS